MHDVLQGKMLEFREKAPKREVLKRNIEKEAD